MADQADKGGIHQLLEAEKDAQQIVANARAAKTARLREAQDEATREIAAYRAQREAEYRRKIAESTGSSGETVKRLEGETASKIEVLQSGAAEIAGELTQLVLKYVTTVRN